jgi:hypothetical protein
MMIHKHTALPPPRNRGLPRLRIFVLRKSGRPDLRRGRAGERGSPESHCPSEGSFDTAGTRR